MAKAPIDIRSLARSHTKMALRVLQSIARDKESPQSARVSAAMALLDRGWGKPTQLTEVTGKDGERLIPDGASDDQRIQALASLLEKNKNHPLLQ